MKAQHDAYFNIEFIRAASLMNDEEKDAVIDVMKNKVIDIVDVTQSDSIVELEEMEEDIHNISEDIHSKVKNVNVKLPVLKLDEIQPAKETSRESVQTPVPSTPKTMKKKKIFICNLCDEEFPHKFLDLADHKVKTHKMSKKESQVISMKHVRYETIEETTNNLSSSKKWDELSNLNLKKEKDVYDEEGDKQKLDESAGQKIKQELKDTTESDKIFVCVLCKVKIFSKKKYNRHIKEKHFVSADKIPLLEDDGKTLFSVTESNEGINNLCKLCGEECANLGILWNHYRSCHRAPKETIKNLITKTKCKICGVEVTFIADHIKTFHSESQETPSDNFPSEKVTETLNATPSKTAAINSENQKKLLDIWSSARKKQDKESDKKKSTHGDTINIKAECAKCSFILNSAKDLEKHIQDFHPDSQISNTSKKPQKETDLVEKVQSIMQEKVSDKNNEIIENNKNSDNESLTDAGFKKPFSIKFEVTANEISTDTASPSSVGDPKSPSSKNLPTKRKQNEESSEQVKKKKKSSTSNASKPIALKQEPPEDDEFHFCDDCDYISNNESDYQAHVKKNHANAQENVSLESGSSSSSTGKKRNVGQQISNSDLSEIFSKSSAKKIREEEESQSNPENNLQEQIITETVGKEQHERDKQKYVAKLMDKLKDMDDSDEDEDDPDEEAIDDNDSNDVPTKESSDNYIAADNEKKEDDNVVKNKLDNQVSSIDYLPDQEEIDKVGLILPEDPDIQMIGTKTLHKALNTTTNKMLEKLQLMKVNGITTQFVTRLKQSRFFQSNPGAVTMTSSDDKETLSLFTHDQSLGKGWKVRYYAVASPFSGIDREFLSPEGLRLKSAEAVVEYMRCIGRYQSSHIQSVKDYLRIN